MPRLLRGRAVGALVAMQIGAFGLLTIALLVTGYLYARQELSRQLDAAMGRRMAGLVETYRQSGRAGLVDMIDRYRDRAAHDFSYRLAGPDGRAIIGARDVPTLASGWSEIPVLDYDDGGIDPARVYTVRLSDGSRLSVLIDRDYIERFDETLAIVLAGTFVVVGGLAVAGGLGIERAVRRRLTAMNATATAIIDGDLSRRVPTSGGQDEFDALAETLNRMLDRMERLIVERGRLTGYLAHDLRAPLLHMQRELERTATRCDDVARCAVDVAALRLRCGEILALFDAMLELGELGAAPATPSGLVDLSGLAAELAESFVPVFEDGGRVLMLRVEPGVAVQGSRSLLGQLLVNLLENGLHHTPAGTRVSLSLEQAGRTARLVVADDAPPFVTRDGLPFDRASASGGSDGARAALGLKLVRAIATGHHGTMRIAETDDGFVVTIELPAAR